MNISMLLDMAADGAPDRVAVGSRSGGITYAEVQRRSRILAGMLIERGVERLGLIDLNSNVTPVCLFGAAAAGIPFAPVNYRLPDDQLTAILHRLAPAMVVVGEGVQERVGNIEGIEMIERDEFLALVEGGSEPDDLPFVDDDAIAVLLFTSGTTGEPKAAVLRHRHLSGYVLGSVEFMGFDEEEAQLVSVPPYHIAGISAILSSIFGGRRIFYLPAFDADEWVQAVADESITQAMVVPTMLGRILQVMDRTGEKLPSLRHMPYGGGRMPVELIRVAMEKLPHVSFVNSYGLTETSSTIALLGPDEHREALASDNPHVQGRLGSVGQPLPSVEVQIRDIDGHPLPPYERGEVYVRGEQVSGEYLGSSVLDADGWFPTKDAGHLDEEGYLYLDGRLDDVIVRGAENLSPGEIEDTLLMHPAVAEAAVVGVPDLEWGETVGAVVVLNHGATASADELQAHVRGHLRSTKTPEIVEFRDELPYNETGKLLRRVLRAELTDLKGHQS